MKLFLAVLNLEPLWAALFLQVLAEITVILRLKIMNIRLPSTAHLHRLGIKAGRRASDGQKERERAEREGRGTTKS